MYVSEPYPVIFYNFCLSIKINKMHISVIIYYHNYVYQDKTQIRVLRILIIHIVTVVHY